jgi:uncharacterized protein (TIGR01777 family)
MKVAITGSSGLIGSALTAALVDDHEVIRLVRRAPTGANERAWNPAGENAGLLDGVDAVVHLGGVGIGDKRWTAAQRRAILDSRIVGTRSIVRAINTAHDGPGVFVCGSAIGWYGSTGSQAVDEAAPSGSGFLADVVRAWEAEAGTANDAQVRTVLARTGVVLSPTGGLLAKVLPLFKAGVGGKLGSGSQYMSWISLDDEVAALTFLLTADVSGPVNLTAPEPVTNSEFTATLGKAVHRPAVLPVPSLALRAALGGLADEGALISQRILPGKLQAAGFQFTDGRLSDALARMI